MMAADRAPSDTNRREWRKSVESSVILWMLGTCVRAKAHSPGASHLRVFRFLPCVTALALGLFCGCGSDERDVIIADLRRQLDNCRQAKLRAVAERDWQAREYQLGLDAVAEKLDETLAELEACKADGVR